MAYTSLAQPNTLAAHFQSMTIPAAAPSSGAFIADPSSRHVTVNVSYRFKRKVQAMHKLTKDVIS